MFISTGNDDLIWCRPMTQKQWSDNTCVWVTSTNEYDIYVCHETYYYCRLED